MFNENPFIIAPETFNLIQQLQKLDELKTFYLVGGTALALKLGHRNSIDIDLFTQDEYNTGNIIDLLNNHFSFELDKTFANCIFGYINDVKVDFVRHNYSYLKPPITENGITYLSLEDISAMKLHAITNSGKRLKDFVDIYFLLEHFSLNEMLAHYGLKYPNFNPVIPVRAVNYFDDIDFEIDPPKLFSPLSIDTIKRRIRAATLNSNKKFQTK